MLNLAKSWEKKQTDKKNQFFPQFNTVKIK